MWKKINLENEFWNREGESRIGFRKFRFYRFVYLFFWCFLIVGINYLIFLRFLWGYDKYVDNDIYEYVYGCVMIIRIDSFFLVFIRVC